MAGETLNNFVEDAKKINDQVILKKIDEIKEVKNSIEKAREKACEELKKISNNKPDFTPDSESWKKIGEIFQNFFQEENITSKLCQIKEELQAHKDPKSDNSNELELCRKIIEYLDSLIKKCSKEFESVRLLAKNQDGYDWPRIKKFIGF